MLTLFFDRYWAGLVRSGGFGGEGINDQWDKECD